MTFIASVSSPGPGQVSVNSKKIMEKKRIVITGATDGIGKMTARMLAEKGHEMIIHGRNRAKAEAVRDEIARETGNPDIHILIADLLSLADVRNAIVEFKKKYDRLDVLINNAGAFFGKHRETTEEGLEKTMTLNLFAPFLLMQLLLDLLAESPSARIINISSSMHRRAGKPDLNDFQLEKKYSPDKAYGLSKLYLIWITRHLATSLKEKGITNISVNASHPGAVSTNFGQDADKGFFINMVFKIALLFMDKVEDGAMTSVYLATSPDVEKVSGQFYSNRKKPEQADDRYYSPQSEQMVWDYCREVVKPYL